MKLNELTKNVKNQLEQKLNIVKSITIINIPKQTVFEKGDLIILLDEKNKPITSEFLKTNGICIEIKNTTIPKVFAEEVLAKDLILFETEQFNIIFDNNYYIDYKNLASEEKKDLIAYIKRSEKILTESSLRFGKIDKSKLTKQLNNQTGFFDEWMVEHGFNKPDNQCLLEAFTKAEKYHDHNLKKRAYIAKCIHNLSLLKEVHHGRKI